MWSFKGSGPPCIKLTPMRHIFITISSVGVGAFQRLKIKIVRKIYTPSFYYVRTERTSKQVTGISTTNPQEVEPIKFEQMQHDKRDVARRAISSASAESYSCKHRKVIHRKKNSHIRGYFVASFHILTEPVLYAFVSVNRRNNEELTHIAMLGPGLHQTWKTRLKISVDIRIFFFTV